MGSSEMRAFVFAVSYIIIFTALLSAIPIDLQGTGATVENMIPVNPNLMTDFSESKQFQKDNFTGVLSLYYIYDIPTGGTTFECIYASNSFYVAAHVIFLGLWLGGLEYVEFVTEDGTNRGNALSFIEIDTDANDGVVRYNLIYEDNGNSAGGFIFYWNTTTYSGSSSAWTADALYLVHGVGITAETNIVSLLLGLLFLQIPSVPPLVNILLIGPLWVSIIYVAWFLITSMIPLIGGS